MGVCMFLSLIKNIPKSIKKFFKKGKVKIVPYSCGNIFFIAKTTKKAINICKVILIYGDKPVLIFELIFR